VSTVKGYAQHEEDVFTQVAQARAGLLGAVQKGDPREMANANDQLTGALGRLMVVAEAYPQLKADQNFLKLQDELTGTENRIAVARTDYNNAVQTYNTYIRTLPQSLTAKVTGARRATISRSRPGCAHSADRRLLEAGRETLTVSHDATAAKTYGSANSAAVSQWRVRQPTLSSPATPRRDREGLFVDIRSGTNGSQVVRDERAINGLTALTRLTPCRILSAP
jgi:hypothetical protein